MTITYKDAGVDKEAGYKEVQLIKNIIKKTHTEGVISDIGGFAGLFQLDSKSYKEPVLVSGTDGVGTKLKLAFMMDKHNTIGEDCVAMCVNDILCQGAKPLFFLDYIATGKLIPEKMAEIVEGIANGCIKGQCALIGGETAEMPGFYSEGEYDIAGFAVGAVEKDEIIDGSKIKEGNALIGIASSGIHSNGYSLVRKLITDLDQDFNGENMGDVLLKPTKIYVKPIQKLMEKFEIKGMAHVTGGGFYENIPRMFKGDFKAVINKNSFNIPEIFKYMMTLGVSEEHMFNTFNMGIGFVVCVEDKDSEDVIKSLESMGEKAYKIGYVKAGEKGLCLE